jgi:hypothetical protein
MAELTAREALARRTTAEHLLAAQDLQDALSRRSRSQSPSSPPAERPPSPLLSPSGTFDVARLTQLFEEQRRADRRAANEHRREDRRAAAWRRNARSAITGWRMTAKRGVRPTMRPGWPSRGQEQHGQAPRRLHPQQRQQRHQAVFRGQGAGDPTLPAAPPVPVQPLAHS